MVKDEVTKFTSYKRERTKAFLIKVCHSNYVTFFFFLKFDLKVSLGWTLLTKQIEKLSIHMFKFKMKVYIKLVKYL